MKYLLLIAVIAVACLLWRNARIARDPRAGGRPPGTPPAPQEMVSCAACGLHLPQADAVTGSDGQPYCSQEHRLRAGA